MTLPTFLIIGVHRPGTTALWDWLGRHPEIFMARPKELHFFDVHFDRGLARYEQKFASAPAGALRGETTPQYIYDPVALRRMVEVAPQAKLIVSLRDPVDQAFSRNPDTRVPQPSATLARWGGSRALSSTPLDDPFVSGQRGGSA